jgi:2-methylcitrate dehydratase PrpD
MADLMQVIVKYALETNYEDLPNEVVDSTKKSILDVIGVTIAGSTGDGVKSVVDLVKGWGGRGESTILVYGGKVPAVHASLAIGPMARAWDIGDVYQSPEGRSHPIRGHPTETIFPVALPAAELRGSVTGKEFITAMAVGQDLVNRFYATVLGPSPPLRGTQHIYFAATAVAARLLGLDEGTAWNAMGISFGQAAGERQSLYKEGTLMIRMEHGLLASAAIRSAILAKHGITGPKNILQGEYGYYKAYEPEYDLAPLTSGLGRVFAGPQATIKAYPGVIVVHALIDAALDIVTTFHVKAEDVEKIEIVMGEKFYNVVCLPEEIKNNPRTVIEAQFSAPYVVATAIAKRRVWMEDFTEDSIRNQVVRRLMSVAKARVDPKVAAVNPCGGEVTIQTKDGNKHTKQVIYPKGHPKNPMTIDDIIRKFRKCLPFSARPFPDSNVDEIIRMVGNLEEIADMTKLVDLLVPGS